MPKDRARKQATRAAQNYTNRAYMDARRQMEDQTPKLREAPPAQVPAPVAQEMARQLYAAWLHLGTVKELVENYGITPSRHAGQQPKDPVGRAQEHLTQLLFDLLEWAGRTAHASNAVSAEPRFMAQSGTPEARAFAQLYPHGDGSVRWCREPGGTMPQPGQEDGQGEQKRRVNTHLVGPVPERLFSVHGYQGNPAGPAVRATPAAAVWDARSRLNAYLCQHWEQAGDTPADLAATVEGLSRTAGELTSACRMVLDELDRRTDDGVLVVKDVAEYTVAVQEARMEIDNNGSSALERVRWTLSGAQAALGSQPRRQPAFAARSFLTTLNGKSLAHMRCMLGDERHLSKQISKTRPVDERRVEALQDAILWMHATHATVYDASAHLRSLHAPYMHGTTRAVPRL